MFSSFQSFLSSMFLALVTMIPFLLPLILYLIFNKRLTKLNRIFSIVSLAAFYFCMIAEITWEGQAPYLGEFPRDAVIKLGEYNSSASSYLFILLFFSLLAGLILAIISRKSGKPDPFYIFWIGGFISVVITVVLYIVSAINTGAIAFVILKYAMLRLLIMLLLLNFTFNNRNTAIRKALWFHLPFCFGLILFGFSIANYFIVFGSSDSAINNAYYMGITFIIVLAVYLATYYCKNHNTISKISLFVNSKFKKK